MVSEITRGAKGLLAEMDEDAKTGDMIMNCMLRGESLATIQKDFHYGRHGGCDDPHQNLEVIHLRVLSKRRTEMSTKKFLVALRLKITPMALPKSSIKGRTTHGA
jgi:hypothetical protein